MVRPARFLSLALFALSGFTVSAQLPLLDATLVDNGNNQLELRVRPDGFFDGLFSSLVFTIRWDAASGANLGSLTPVPPADEYIGINKSGGEQDDMGDRYQVFAGFGFTPLSSVPATWNAGVEYALVTIPVLNGSSTFELVNNAWTSANNADYYVSLNGQDRTGALYQLSTGVTMGDVSLSGLDVQPNPSEGVVGITFRIADPQDVRIEVLNSLGQQVLTERLNAFSGEYRGSLDLSAFGSGVYVLNLRTATGVSTQRLVVR
jgi:Secretion system C-terminal sorting domain